MLYSTKEDKGRKGIAARQVDLKHASWRTHWQRYLMRRLGLKWQSDSRKRGDYDE